MKKLLSFGVVLFLMLAPVAASAFPADIEGLCFSPNGGCARMIISAIDNAQSEILVMAYSFTNQKIADALLRAKKRGVDVRVIQDRGEAMKHWSKAPYLVRANIPVYLDTEAGIYHDKVLVADRTLVETGSYNFSYAASRKNAENAMLIRSNKLADYYVQNWLQHAQNDPLMSASAGLFRSLMR